MKLNNIHIGLGLTGSFCTYSKIYNVIEDLMKEGAIIHPIFSFASQSINSRFGMADEFIKKIKELTGIEPVTTIEDAEPLGPSNILDIMLIAPCTGNTLAKLSNAITDTPVLMAVKGHMRNNKPVVISLSSNDALGFNLKNIGEMLNAKNMYFVPFGQDNYESKPKSMLSHTELIPETLELALDGKQLQPIVQSPFNK